MSDSTAEAAPQTEKKVTFKTLNATIDVSLPSMEGSRVTLRKDMTSQEAENIALMMPDGEMNQRSANIVMMRMTIAAMFISWNLVDEEEKDLPCTIETLKKFRFTDLAAMMQAITGKQIVDSEGNFMTPAESKKKPLSE